MPGNGAGDFSFASVVSFCFFIVCMFVVCELWFRLRLFDEVLKISDNAYKITEPTTRLEEMSTLCASYDFYTTPMPKQGLINAYLDLGLGRGSIEGSTLYFHDGWHCMFWTLLRKCESANLERAMCLRELFTTMKLSFLWNSKPLFGTP